MCWNKRWQHLGVACLPDEVERLLFVKAEKTGPVLVQVVALTLAFSIPCPFPVSTLKGKETMQYGAVEQKLKKKISAIKVHELICKCWTIPFIPSLKIIFLETFQHIFLWSEKENKCLVLYNVISKEQINVMLCWDHAD